MGTLLDEQNATRDVGDVVEQMTNTDENVGAIAWTPPAQTTVLVPKNLNNAINAVLASEHCHNIAMIGYCREFGKVRRELRSRMDILDETHRNITRGIEEQNRGSIAMGRLATSNATLHDQLSLTQQGLQELMTNKDARRAQMTNHWQCMGALDFIIQQVGKRITATINQNLLLNAQMKDVRTTIKTAATAVRTDITNLRSCIILDLRSALASLKSEVLDLHDLSVSLKSEDLELQEQVSTMKGTFTSASQAHPPPASEWETTLPSPPDEQPRPLDEAPACSNTTDGNSPPRD
jgi:hypothetical protein